MILQTIAIEFHWQKIKNLSENTVANTFKQLSKSATDAIESSENTVTEAFYSNA
jgi:hypothetical protein